MLISMWSPTKGHGKVTSTLATLASFIVSRYIGRVAIFDYKCTGDLERVFGIVDKPSPNEGMGAVKRFAESGKLSSGSLPGASTPIVSGKLDLLRTDSGSEGMERILVEVARVFRKDYDLTFVDLGHGQFTDETNAIMESSDLVIVCLNQYQDVGQEIRVLVDEVPKGVPILFLKTEYESQVSTDDTTYREVFGIQNKDIAHFNYNVDLKLAVSKSELITTVWKLPEKRTQLFKMTDQELLFNTLDKVTNKIFDKMEYAMDKEGGTS